MTPSDDSPAGRLHEAIQNTNDSDPDIEGAVLVGWTLVAEWMDGEGKRWLSGLTGCNGGEDSLPVWQNQGYLWNALYEGFVDENQED